MGQVQFWEGSILFDTGKVAMDAACCCVEECPDCPTTPYMMRGVLAGVTNCGCLADGSESRYWYGDPNGIWYFEQCASNPCAWQTESAAGNPMTVKVYATSDCTGDYDEYDGKIWGYIEYLGDSFVGEMHVEIAELSILDAIFQDLSGISVPNCDVEDEVLTNAILSGNCGSGTASALICTMPEDTGKAAFYGGTLTITSVMP